jgi:hypothetical protein
VNNNDTRPFFTKKHYIAIAGTLGRALAQHPTDATGIALAQVALGRLFERDNPAFDVGRFDAAVDAEREARGKESAA